MKNCLPILGEMIDRAKFDWQNDVTDAVAGLEVLLSCGDYADVVFHVGDRKEVSLFVGCKYFLVDSCAQGDPVC